MNMFKKAFTLAEVLVVLTTIGVIAAISIPQLTSGIKDAQYRTGYKKAYTALAEVVGIEKANNRLPKAANEAAMISFFKALDKNLKIEGYVDRIGNNTVLPKGSVHQGMVWKGDSYGDPDDSFTSAATNSTKSPWIVTKDNMAFCITVPSSGTCEKRSEINANEVTSTEAASKSCFYISIDVNGLYKGPNSFNSNDIASNQKLKKLTGDRFNIAIARDGIASGSAKLTVTGRLHADEK